MRATLGDRTLDLTGDSGQTLRYHYVWLRDNCWCGECRVEQTAERILLTWSIPEDIRATKVDSVTGGLVVDWSDGHRSTYSLKWLKDNDYMEFDDFMARRRVLLGIHKPVPSGSSI